MLVDDTALIEFIPESKKSNFMKFGPPPYTSNR
jgi:hypothetical protein